MLRLVTQKIKNKLWLTVCLTLGLTFLVAVCACQPMFKSGSLNRLLEQTFIQYIQDNNAYPTVISKTTDVNLAASKVSTDAIINEIEKYNDVWRKNVKSIGELDNQTILSLQQASAQGTFGSKGDYLSITYIPDIESHVQILKGEIISSEPMDDAYPCMLSESVLDENNLIVGSVYDFITVTTAGNKTLKLKVTGVFRESDENDVFWFETPNTMKNEVIVTKDTMDMILADYNVTEINARNNIILDYRDIDSTNVNSLIDCLAEFKSLDKSFSNTMEDMLDGFVAKRKSVGVMLWVLEIPMLGMVLAFIYMVSGQLLETEKNEIAMFKSRGFKRSQIVSIYFLQATILSLFALVLGIALGYVACILAASTTDFLTFSGKSIDCYHFVPSMIGYGVGAAFVGILFIVGPACLASNISIVEYMSQKNINKKMFWEKSFLDVILLVLSVYFLYYFSKTDDSIRQKAIEGGNVDPMVFMDSILFIVAFGLVVLRLSHYLVKLVYRIGKKKWKPAMYASFLQITRSFNKQGFISVFMILTVAMGIYNANGARTINRNKEDRLQYEIGCDTVFKEEWKKTPFRVGFDTHYKYEEPDFVKYEELINSGLVTNIAQVQRIDGTEAKAPKGKVTNTTIMGINTKQFGETAILKDELNYPTHWYNYLNDLSQATNGAIISSNLAEELGLEVGKTITVYGKNKDQVDSNQSVVYQIVDIVDAWPGFTQYSYVGGEEIPNYLVVVNLQNVIRAIEQKPYEIWVKYADGTTSEQLRQKLIDMNVPVEQYVSLDDNISYMKSSPDIQITNGMFTLGFLIALVLCGIGFLIYWISSIRQRELLFGVYRAMGMSVSHVNKMLLNEHVFSTLLSVISGTIVGMVSTFLFIKVMAIVYLPQRHNLDIYIYFEAMDIVKLLVALAIMIIICLFVLRKIIKSMNITQALKLGED